MNLLIFKDLSENSGEIAEAIRLLQYSLHLNFNNHPPVQPDINSVFSVCHDICKPLLGDNLNFFGNNIADINCTPEESLKMLYENFRDNDFWITAIKYHCVISSLFTLRSVFLKDNFISSYQLKVHAKESGFLTLKKKGYLESNCFKRYISGDETIKENFSSDCSNFKTMFKTFYNGLTSQEQEALHYDSKEARFSLENSDYVYRIFKNRQCFNQLHKYYINDILKAPKDYTEFFFKNVVNFSDSFYADSNEANVVDQILLAYRTERYYNLSLTTELYSRLLKLFSEKKNGSFKMPDTSILSTCFTLPNVFSRNLFLSYAFDSYDNTHLDENTFYYRNKNAGPVSYVSSASLGIDRHLTWVNLFKSFHLFFSSVIFPIYEKCFFILLKEAFDLKSICPDNSVQLMDTLNNYILENSHDILSGGFSSSKTRNHLAEDLSVNIMAPQMPNSKIILSRDDTVRFNLILKDIIATQSNLIHFRDAPLFNSDYFGMQLATDEHNSLLTLYVNSALRYMGRPF